MVKPLCLSVFTVRGILAAIMRAIGCVVAPWNIGSALWDSTAWSSYSLCWLQLLLHFLGRILLLSHCYILCRNVRKEDGVQCCVWVFLDPNAMPLQRYWAFSFGLRMKLCILEVYKVSRIRYMCEFDSCRMAADSCSRILVIRRFGVWQTYWLPHSSKLISFFIGNVDFFVSVELCLFVTTWGHFP